MFLSGEKFLSFPIKHFELCKQSVSEITIFTTQESDVKLESDVNIRRTFLFVNLFSEKIG